MEEDGIFLVTLSKLLVDLRFFHERRLKFTSDTQPELCDEDFLIFWK